MKASPNEINCSIIARVFILSILWPFFNPAFTQAPDSIQVVTDSVTFKGQASVWGIYNPHGTYPVLAGGRYIPTLNYGIRFPGNRLLDLEASVNAYGTVASHPFDSADLEGDISIYRAWARYSSSQWELRLGLQKINFGSSYLFRPLMWFDQIDPRDPLKLTNGVRGLLSRYYFMNNANLWLWCLYGNEQPRPWDIGITDPDIPEAGFRFQHPVRSGEIALSYHFRMADTRGIDSLIPSYAEIPENRIGIDTKLDFNFGIWFEGAWITKSKDLGMLTNQEIITLGADYTIPMGNGLYFLFEQLLYSTDEKPFEMANRTSYSGLTITYPIGVTDYLSTIIYYDWDNHYLYNFVNWNHRFKWLDFYVMVYWNPEEYKLPQTGDMSDTFAGPGIQIMLVFNH